MARFTSYSNKAKPTDSDTLLINDSGSSSNKQVSFTAVLGWVKDKLGSSTIDGLDTTSKNVVGAINELHNEVGGKADSSSVYTKSQVDALIESVDVETDTTLSVSGKPADAKKTGDEISAIKADLGDLSELETETKTDLVSAINEVAQSGGSGFPDEARVLLINILRKAVYSEDTSIYISALNNVLKISQESGDEIDTYYSITYDLEHITSSATNETIKSGNALQLTLTANPGYRIDTVTVTMDGLDVTSSAYANGIVSIASVTGNIEISGTTVPSSLQSFNSGVYEPSYRVTISNGNHVKIEGSSSNETFKRINLSQIGESFNQQSTFFLIPSGSTVVTTIKNLSGTPSGNCNIEAYNTGEDTYSALMSNKKISNNQSATFEAQTDLDVGSIVMLFAKIEAESSYEFDIEITVDGALYIG